MIANDMSVLARRALDEDCASVVAELGDAVCGAVFAGLTGEGQLVGGCIRSGSPVRRFWIWGCACRRCELRIVPDRDLGEWCRPQELRG